MRGPAERSLLPLHLSGPLVGAPPDVGDRGFIEKGAGYMPEFPSLARVHLDPTGHLFCPITRGDQSREATHEGHHRSDAPLSCSSVELLDLERRVEGDLDSGQRLAHRAVRFCRVRCREECVVVDSRDLAANCQLDAGQAEAACGVGAE